MLKIENCTFNYRHSGEPAIKDFLLEFGEGGVYGLLGANGAGKSTLLQLMAGLLTPETGRVTFDGEDVRRRLPSVMREIFIVPEEIELPPLKAARFMAVRGAMYPRFSMSKAERYLEIFDVPSSQRLDALSMGQKKKVALAFAMACNTRILLMYEPTNGLDIPGKSAFRKIVVESSSDDRVFVISTHQVRDVNRILDHILIMDRSKVLLDCNVADIQDSLVFMDTSDSDLISRSIYAEKWIGGASVVIENREGLESELNLELLFNCVVSCPEAVAKVLNNRVTG